LLETSEEGKSDLWKACQHFFRSVICTYNISSCSFIEAKNILKSVLHPHVEITDDLCCLEKKLPHFSAPAIRKKDRPSRMEKHPFFLATSFLVTEINKPTSSLTEKKVCFYLSSDVSDVKS
jgi:hypothetical protein